MLHFKSIIISFNKQSGTEHNIIKMIKGNVNKTQIKSRSHRIQWVKLKIIKSYFVHGNKDCNTGFRRLSTPFPKSSAVAVWIMSWELVTFHNSYSTTLISNNDVCITLYFRDFLVPCAYRGFTSERKFRSRGNVGIKYSLCIFNWIFGYFRTNYVPTT